MHHLQKWTEKNVTSVENQVIIQTTAERRENQREAGRYIAKCNIWTLRKSQVKENRQTKKNESKNHSSTISAWSGIQINCSRIINGNKISGRHEVSHENVEEN